MEIAPSHHRQSSALLSSWETSTIEVFIRAASLIGLPRSIGEIYGLLFCADQPLAFDDLGRRLEMSRGSVSQGLKFLRQLGAVKLHYIAGSRKDYYEPELSMGRLVRGFVRDQFSPYIETGNARLNAIDTLIQSEEDLRLRKHATQRIQTLRTWQSRIQKLLPLIMAALAGANFFNDQTETREDVI
jgi:HTH-type transcriptional regulator, glycine betaine synthesis regulator